MKSSIVTLFSGILMALLLLAECSSLPMKRVVTAPSTLTPEPSPTDQLGSGTEEVNMLALSSTAFSENGTIAERYTYKLGRQCSGENYSPPLQWEGVPGGTKSLLLTVIDPDGGNWVHWLLFNIPPDIAGLEEAVNSPQVGIAGRNDFGGVGYGGPCPPSGTHRYIFTLYALDTVLDAGEGTRLKSILPLTEGHVLAKATLTGLKSAK